MTDMYDSWVVYSAYFKFLTVFLISFGVWVIIDIITDKKNDDNDNGDE